MEAIRPYLHSATETMQKGWQQYPSLSQYLPTGTNNFVKRNWLVLTLFSAAALATVGFVAANVISNRNHQKKLETLWTWLSEHCELIQNENDEQIEESKFYEDPSTVTSLILDEKYKNLSSLPAEIELLRNLTTLKFPLSSDNMETLPKELARFPLLSRLELKFLDNLKDIPKELFDAEFPNLEEISLLLLEDNNFDSNLAKLIVNQAMQGSIFALLFCRNFRNHPHLPKPNEGEQLTEWIENSNKFENMPDNIRAVAKKIREQSRVQ